jgi:serine/threonine protein kinase
MAKRTESLDLKPGRRLAGKYEVVECLGRGWEGEVYRVREDVTGIEQAAKFFYPEHNQRDKAIKFHARKLHKLRHCSILIQYLTLDEARIGGQRIKFLVSELVEGELLSEFLSSLPGKRMQAFEAMHLLHDLAVGLEEIHRARDYHGDLHTDNILISRRGIHFDLKLVDLFHWSAPTRENILADVVAAIGIFHEALGGWKHYAKQPSQVKEICKGMKPSLIRRKFRSAAHLRSHLETMSWD